jgi:hypothetical protein
MCKHCDKTEYTYNPFKQLYCDCRVRKIVDEVREYNKTIERVIGINPVARRYEEVVGRLAAVVEELQKKVDK